MKKAVLALIVSSVLTTSVLARPYSQGQAQGQAQGQLSVNTNTNHNSNTNLSSSNSLAGALANNEGNSQNIDINYESADFGQIVPNVYAPALTTGACMGSASGGASGAGFGLSFGSTVVDEECQIRRNAILLHQLHLQDASHRILCQIESISIALNEVNAGTCYVEEAKKSTSRFVNVR